MRRRALKRPVITKFWNEKTRDKTEGENLELENIKTGEKETITVDELIKKLK